MRMILASSLLAAAALSGSAWAAEDEVLVVTALPFTYSITSALAEGTEIEVRNVPEQGRRPRRLASLLEQRGAQFRETFAEATAVVTIGKLWPEDPLFTAARSANVRVVEIDATKPWSTTLEGVTVAEAPRGDAPWDETSGQGQARSPSIYFWQSPANGVRSAEIVARDLQRLAPGDAEQIERNLDRLREELIAMKRGYENKLAMLADVTVVALAPEFVYLTNALGLFVEASFFKQDIDWTDEEVAGFESYLRENDIGVVLHKWEPLDPIMGAITAAGSGLVVLDPIASGSAGDGPLLPDSYIRLLRRNLELLYAGLLEANDSRKP